MWDADPRGCCIHALGTAPSGPKWALGSGRGAMRILLQVRPSPSRGGGGHHASSQSQAPCGFARLEVCLSTLGAWEGAQASRCAARSGSSMRGGIFEVRRIRIRRRGSLPSEERLRILGFPCGTRVPSENTWNFRRGLPKVDHPIPDPRPHGGTPKADREGPGATQGAARGRSGRRRCSGGWPWACLGSGRARSTTPRPAGQQAQEAGPSVRGAGAEAPPPKPCPGAHPHGMTGVCPSAHSGKDVQAEGQPRAMRRDRRRGGSGPHRVVAP